MQQQGPSGRLGEAGTDRGVVVPPAPDLRERQSAFFVLARSDRDRDVVLHHGIVQVKYEDRHE